MTARPYLWWKLVKVTSNIANIEKSESSRSSDRSTKFILRIRFWSEGALPASPSFVLHSYNFKSGTKKVEAENKGWWCDQKRAIWFVGSFNIRITLSSLSWSSWSLDSNGLDWNGFVFVVIVLIDGDVIIIWKVKGDGFFDVNCNFCFWFDWVQQMGFLGFPSEVVLNWCLGNWGNQFGTGKGCNFSFTKGSSSVYLSFTFFLSNLPYVKRSNYIKTLKESYLR